MLKLCVFDIETANDPGLVGWRNFKKMEFACGALVSFSIDEANQVTKSERTHLNVKDLADDLDEHDLVIGFNNHKFDNQFIFAHAGADRDFAFKSFDVLEDLAVRTKINFVTNLDRLGRATLGKGKGEVDGKDTPKLWKAGEKEKVIEYCLDDCRLLLDVLLFGVRYGYVLTSPNVNESLFGDLVLKIEVDWRNRLVKDS